MNAYFRAGMYSEAVGTIENIISRLQTAGDKNGLHELLLWKARFLTRLYRFEEAQKIYAETLSYRERTLGPANPHLLPLLDEYARMLHDTGDYSDALMLYDRALEIKETVFGPDHPETAQALNSLAGTAAAAGDYDTARTLYEHAVSINRDAYGHSHETVALTLNNLGEIHRLLGDMDTALNFFEKALAICSSAESIPEPLTASVLNNIALLHTLSGRTGEAEKLYRRALKLFISANGAEHISAARAMSSLAAALLRTGDLKTAQSLTGKALGIIKKNYGPDHPHAAVCENNLGEIGLSASLHADAKDHFKRALVIAYKNNQPELIWRALYNMARLSAAQKNTAAAVFFGKQSVNTIQSMRKRLRHMDPGLRNLFLQDKASAYRFLSSLLIDAGRLPEARQVISMMKEEEYCDFILRQGSPEDESTARTAFSAAEVPWSKRYERISGRIAALGREYGLLIEKDRRQQATAQDLERLNRIDNDLIAAGKHFGACLAEIISYFDTVTDPARLREIGKKDLQGPSALQGTIGELGSGVVLIHYLVLDEALKILVTTPAVQFARESRTGEAELNRLIFDFRQGLRNPRRDPLPPARKLYRRLLKPIEEDLAQAGASTLMLSLDGALRYIPFAALHDGTQYVAERYATVIFTEASRDKIKDKPAESWKLAGLGLSRGIPELNLSPLPAVPDELDGIISTGGDDEAGILPGKIYLNNEFNYSSVRAVLRRRYPVLHIASHFIFKPGNELSSFLMLGDGSTLPLHRVRDELRFTGVDMITLSACDTAMGGARYSGREIEGFGALVQRKGAKSVLATLWPVADRSTGRFMQHLYTLRREKTESKAAALQRTQQAFINGDMDTEDNGLKKRGTAISLSGSPPAGGSKRAARPASLAHPYFWAPFILMGNWL